jgi:uncharacterized protein involved in response to NO
MNPVTFRAAARSDPWYKYGYRPTLKTLTVVVVLLWLQGCTAMVVGATVGVVTAVAIETAKVPFKVTGAVIDVATDGEDD